jgi:Ner family transcriptional regulator
MSIKPSDVPTDQFQRAQWVMTQLRLRGTNLSQLAREHGLHSQVFSLALRGPHARAEEVIAEALGTTPRVLFPERFTANGVRIYRRRLQPSKPPSRSTGNVTRVAAQR